MGPKSQFCPTEHRKARFQKREYHKPIGVEYAGKVTAGVRERVICGLTNAAHLHRNAKQGGTLSVQVLERGNEECEDSCAAAAAGVAVISNDIVAFLDTAYKLGIAAEPVRMSPGSMISKGE